MDEERSRTTELLKRFHEGDRAALEELFRRYYDRVKRIVRMQMGPGVREKIESGDVLQETFEAAQKSLPNFEPRGKGALLSWFARISEHRIQAAVDYFGAAKRDRALEQSLDAVRSQADSDDFAMQPESLQPGPDQKCADREQAQILEEELMKLSEDQREAIVQREFVGAAWEAIAVTMGRTSANAARMLYSRAVAQLASNMARRNGGEP